MSNVTLTDARLDMEVQPLGFFGVSGFGLGVCVYRVQGSQLCVLGFELSSVWGFGNLDYEVWGLES